MNDNSQEWIKEEIEACLVDMKQYEKQMKAKGKNKDEGFKMAEDGYEKARSQLSVAREELKGLQNDRKEWETLHLVPEKEKKKIKQKTL